MPGARPGPPIFSITSVWPSVRDIWSPTRRVTTSVGPPAANGTMTVIGLFGYWAAAGALCNESATRLPAIRRPMSAMVFLPPTRRRDDEQGAPFAQVRLAASVLVRAAACWWPSARTSDHLLGLVVGLAVATQRGRLGAGVKFGEAGRDLGVLALEQAVAGKIALHQERPELVDVEHPDCLRQPQFLEPIDAGHSLDAAPEQRAGAVSDRGEIDRVVGHERLAIDLGRHSALAGNDVAARELEPAVEPLREAERGGGGDGADGVAAVGIDGRGRRAVEVGEPERIACGRHAGAVLDGALVDALARGEDAAAEIGHRSDLKLTQIVGRRRKGELDGVELRHRPYSAAATPNFNKLPSGSHT